MKEDFLHFVWKFQQFDHLSLKDVNGNAIAIRSVGQHNLNSGPDFLKAQLQIGKQLWAGNVEIHIRSSDWYVHRHEVDPAYDNIILHVVWENDVQIFRSDNSILPALELKPIISTKLLNRYRKLYAKKVNWIQCEKNLRYTDELLFNNWLTRLFVERLEQKSVMIKNELKMVNNHWEEVLFRLLCKNFGLKVNGDSFLSIGRSLDFKNVQKSAHCNLELESLLLGQAGLLDADKEDGYFKLLQKNYKYLKRKFDIKNSGVIIPKFFRLRPVNFPTIRLSQLAALYTQKKNLFSEINAATTVDDYYEIFDVKANDYWDTHYNFGVRSSKRKKKLSKKFVELLIVNTIIPLKFCFAKYESRDNSDELLALVSNCSIENNAIVQKFNELRHIGKTAFESQGLLQLKSNYCDRLRCTECAIGNSVLSFNSHKR